MKPQASAPKPPQFQHDGIAPRDALLLLGLPLLAAVLLVLVLVASPLLWWIAAGVVAAGVAGAVLLRRSGRARGIARRLPGVARAGAGLRRFSNGRFARSPLGRTIGRTLATGRANRRAAGRRMRAALPPWMGGTRGRRPGGARANNPSGSPAGSRARGRVRAAFARMMPGARGRAARAAAAGRASAVRAGSRSRAASGTGTRSGGRLRAGGATGKPSSGRAAGSKLFGTRPNASSGGSGKPDGKGSKTPPGDGSSDTDAPRKTARGIRRLVGDLAEAITEPEAGMTKDGYSVTKVRSTRELTRPGTGPSWPTEDPDEIKPSKAKSGPPPPVRTTLDPAWPTEDPDEIPPSQPPKQSLPAERDHDPPPSPPASPPSHRESRRETPRITSTNTGGKPMAVSPTMHNDLVTNANTRRQGWQDAADAFRHDANELDEKAREHTRAATAFKSTGNIAAAEERETQARQLRDDANTCRSYASKYQEKANNEQNSAA